MKSAIACAFLIMGLTVSASARDFSPAQQAKLKDTVKQQLLDADSAKFKLPPYQGGQIYCGLVNSKNTYGGYAGDAIFQVFVVTPTLFNFMGIGTSDPESVRSVTMRQSCEQKGYKF
ncbi:hypothetical protein [Pseudomonas sp. RC10]|uniref:hypothetical protein n=1 Tax=Pseudomonas bambusae TaxID=3139142 RepID=UPI00313A2BF1